jgi:SAM-dependent methyltransferase
MSDGNDCGLCGESDFARVWNRGYPGNVRLSTRICKKCGLVQTIPRPNAEEIARFYAQQYRQDYSGVAVPAGAERQLMGVQAGDRFSDLEPHLKARSSILEIGCATGEFLAVLRKAGHRPTGVEPSEACCAEARNVCDEVYAGVIEDQDFAAGRFDGICLFHVLEHLRYPVAALELMRTWLCEGGLIYLEVPDVQQPYWGTLSRFFQTAHLYDFSRNTLTAVLKKAGFCAIWSSRLVEEKYLRIIARKDAQESREIVFPVDGWRQVKASLRAWRCKWLLWYKPVRAVAQFTRRIGLRRKSP